MVSCCWLQELLGEAEPAGLVLLEADGLLDDDALADGLVVAPKPGTSDGMPPPLGEELGDGLVEPLGEALPDGVALPDGRAEPDGLAEAELDGHGLALLVALGLAPDWIV
jgi:hypothetical protein